MSGVFAFGGYVLRTVPRELFREGVRVRLQDQPLQILEELLVRPGQLVTREHLISRLWPKGVVDFDGSLNTAMRKLRAALADDAETPRYVETVPRQGYRFIARLADREHTPTQRSPVQKRRWWAWATLAVVALVAALALVSTSIKSGKKLSLPASVAEVGRPRVAVMPFDNLSSDPDNAFFADGLHEEVLTALAARAPLLDVISRTTMLSYRATAKPVSVIARELGVTHVLEGSVRREGQEVRLTLQLIDARNDTRLWSQSFDRQLTSAMTLQSEVAAEVASRLALRLARDGVTLAPPANPEAYDLYLKARLTAQGFAGRASVERIVEVENLLDRALGLDPMSAAAYLERARMHLRKFDSSYDVSDDNLQAARADLAKVRALAGDVPELLVTESYYAHVVDCDLKHALALISKPQVLASRDVTVMMERADLAANAHHIEEALAIYQNAAQLDPQNQGLMQAWHALLWNARRPREARVVMDRLSPQSPARLSFEFSFAGHTDQLDEAAHPILGSIDPGTQLMARVNRLRFRNRLAESITLLERSELKTMRQDSHSPVTIPAIGRKPVAELHGWAMLLAGKAAAAASDGRILQDFVAHEPATRWNGWFLRLLSAEGELFSGRKTQAIAATRAAMTMTPRGINIAIDRFAEMNAALLYAWADSHDEAVELLAGLATGFPGVGPAEITRDPLYSVPLAGSAKYHALATRLEAEIAANQTLFE